MRTKKLKLKFICLLKLYSNIFNKFWILSTQKSEGILFDPCAGWGGRLLGTVAAGWKYIGCEPNVDTYNNLMRMVTFLNIEDKVTLYNIPYEDLILDSLDSKYSKQILNLIRSKTSK